MSRKRTNSKIGWEHVRKKRSHPTNRTTASRIIGYSSLVLFGLISLALIFPITSASSFALDNTSASASSRLSVKAVETVSVRLASTVSLELEPHSQGSFGVAQTELGVTTNDPEGFEVFLATTDREAALRGATSQIDTIQQDTVGTSFSGNTWGYSIGKNVIDQSTIYHALPTTSSSILKTERATVEMEDVYQLGFGVHITPSLPAGEYSTSVVLSVVANPATISNLQDLVYMQDMTSDICSNTYPTSTDLLTMSDTEKEDAKLHPITKQLYDIRDGKKYWVAKLADGNCWMTQNLALDLDTNTEGNAVAVSESGNKVELNSLNTDITNVWHDYAPSKTETEIPEKTEADYTSARSWNLGNIVLTNPNGANCENISTKADIVNCSVFQAVESNVEQYDAHYLAGNYYQWGAATAGSGIDLSSPISASTNPNDLAIAKDSICPNNWQLPTSGRNTSQDVNWPFNLEKSFYQLLHTYGYPETGSSVNSGTGEAEWVSLWGGYSNISGEGKTSIIKSPLYFTRVGFIKPDSGLFILNSNSGDYWSSAAGILKNTNYDLFMEWAYVYPARGNYVSNGNGIRCLAR